MTQEVIDLGDYLFIEVGDYLFDAPVDTNFIYKDEFSYFGFKEKLSDIDEIKSELKLIWSR